MISLWILLRIINILDRNCTGNQNTHFVFNNFFPPENIAVYEIMWKKCGPAGQAADRNVIRRMRTRCWITKTIDTHSEYVILSAFPRQEWLR